MGKEESPDKMAEIMGRIKNRRTELNMSYQELADKTGLSKSTLQRYETGFIRNMPLDKLEIVAYALNTTPAYLMGWDREDKKDEMPKLVDELAEAAKKLSPENQKKLLDVARVMFGDKIDD